MTKFSVLLKITGTLSVVSLAAVACSAQGDGTTDVGTGGNVGSGGDVQGAGGLASTGGVANSGGAPSGGGASTGGGTTLPAEAILFQEDFESAADDTQPVSWDAFISYNVNVNNTKANGTYALVDSTKAHGGSKALHVVGGSNPAMITRPLPEGTERLYVRAYVWLTNKLGQSPGHNHETLIGVRGTPGAATNEVRFGEIKGVVGANEVPSDDISPTMDQWGAGPLIPSGAWNCIEVAFLGDTDTDQLTAWNDGIQVFDVNAPSQWQNKGLGTDFLTGKFKEVILGWQSFSNYNNEIWFDDLIVATERIGCL